jgi:hypothetical protein
MNGITYFICWKKENGLEGNAAKEREIVIKLIKKGKFDVEITVDLEITAERLQVIKASMDLWISTPMVLLSFLNVSEMLKTM